ncbi:c-type heme family protein [Pseudobacteriovorax antillogorgiicola]|uniref:TIGR01244 family protein n=1 Tax=Pseudobacteriovorax antillogorgiicola TaxID=1513793 RepID=A0A1Y6BT53_9BACT|nr:DUF3365 domain-containing protein [Pseudobacteriovorax antillogorgiicola]TCS53108.1 uncharacterized protein (TIGR01244 family) [Pseudobacteriovorax antillogorgiicola]SMF25646.1 TIGR01244 family protein [Pseudobacteriovorax antillogorgiicola]
MKWKKAVIAILLGGSSLAWAQWDESQVQALKMPQSGVVNDHLIVGGQPDEDDFKSFKSWGVVRVINLRVPGEKNFVAEEEAWAKSAGMEYLSLPVAGKDISLEQSLALKKLLGGQKKTLLHCSSSNRVGALLAINRFLFEPMSTKEALAYGEKHGLKSLEEMTKGVLNDPETQALKKKITAGKKRIKQYGMSLKGKLMDGMKKGPAQAVQSCQLAVKEMRETGSERVGRSSLKVRNPENSPEPALQAVLKEWQDRKVGADDFQLVEDGKSMILAKPIYMQGLCVTCHGAKVSPDIEAQLKKLYPQDLARGYKVGDFRGVFHTEI